MKCHRSVGFVSTECLSNFCSKLVVLLLFSFLSACGGGNSDQEVVLPVNDSSFSSTTISKETAVFDESTIDQIITSELADDDTINITIKSQGTSGQTFEVGKPFLILPGSDESYPFGLSGKISALETNAAGDQVVTLEPITLREVAEESTLDLQSVALSAENFIGVIAPSAIQEAALEARQSASSLPAGAKSALNGGVVVYSEKKL